MGNQLEDVLPDDGLAFVRNKIDKAGANQFLASEAKAIFRGGVDVLDAAIETGNEAGISRGKEKHRPRTALVGIDGVRVDWHTLRGSQG